MTATDAADRWPAEVVEAAAAAMNRAEDRYYDVEAEPVETIAAYPRLMDMARAALAVVPPDPVIAAIREIVETAEAKMDAVSVGGFATYRMPAYMAIADLLLADGAET